MMKKVTWCFKPKGGSSDDEYKKKKSVSSDGE